MTNPSGQPKTNRTIAVVCAVVAISMVGAAYAAVPLYALFCQVTGFGGTTQRASTAPHQILDRKVTVRFDANVAAGLDWNFTPVVPRMTVRIGENALAFFRATNHSSEPVVGTATFNVTPEQAGSFFNKIQCFCFTEQKLEPGETVEMPVSFFVDPAIVNDSEGAYIDNITLSYTFHPVQKQKNRTSVNQTAPAASPAASPSPPKG